MCYFIFDGCFDVIKVGSHCRSHQLDQARSSDREPVWQVVGVVGIDRISYTIIFDCQKVEYSDRVAMRSRSDWEVIGYWSSRGRVDREMIV